MTDVPSAHVRRCLGAKYSGGVRSGGAALLLVMVALLSGCGTTTPPVAISNPTPGPLDWPGFGHDPQHSFDGRTTLTQAAVPKLKKAWFFPTGDAVTATPTVVDGTVYAGSWDGWFYAVDLETGRLDWKYHLSPQHAVTPYPGEKPRDEGSDGGLVTSSAWFESATTQHPALVIFGGGYTLYALEASTGKLFWRHDYTGFPGKPPSPDTDGARIFSSPVVTGGKVIVGVDVDGETGGRGYVAAADVDTGNPVWEFQTDVNSSGTVLDNGCGSVWASGTLLPDLGLIVFDTADCDFKNSTPYSENVFALHIDSGTLAWSFQPSRVDPGCDWDFGATANAGLDSSGHSNFLGVGSKDGTYYSLDPATGALRWSTNVVFGGFSGGFIGTTAYNGSLVVGSTAVGDFGRFESNGPKVCEPGNPRDTTTQNPTTHAFDAANGAIAWQVNDVASFSATTLAGSMTFNDPSLAGTFMDVRVATSGKLLAKVPLVQASWSGIATVGDAVVVGEGSDYSYQPSGIEALTPGGAPPVVPRHLS